MFRTCHFLVASLLLIACSSSTQKAFNDAECLLASHPDSSITILQGLSPQKIFSPHSRARYALLLTIAGNRTGKDFKNNSLAQIAYDYYHHLGSKRNKMLSSYYLATAKADADQTIEATFLYQEAENYADRIKDFHYKGFAQHRLAELYAQNYDYEGFERYNLQAIQSFTLSGDEDAKFYSLIDLARRYSVTGRITNANQILDSLLRQPADANKRARLYQVKGNIFFSKGEWGTADAYYQKIEDLGFRSTIQTYGNRAIIHEHLGRPAQADYFLSLARKQSRTAIDSTIYHSCANDLFQLRKDYKNAFHSLKQTSDYQDKAVSELLARSATHAMKAYLEKRYQLEQAKTQNLSLLISLVILLMLALTIGSIMALKKRRKEIEVERELVNSLKKDLLLLQEEQKTSGAVLDTLLQDKINKIKKISSTFFSWTSEAVYLREEQRGKAMKEEIIEEFRNELRALRDDPHLISDIENALNQAHGQIMRRLRNLVFKTPGINLNERDFELLNLFFANFSSKSISFLLDMTDDAVRKRKSRYKKLFLSHGDAYSEFLSRLE